MERRNLLKWSLPLGLFAVTAPRWLKALGGRDELPASAIPDAAREVSALEAGGAAALPAWFTDNRAHIHTRLVARRWAGKREFNDVNSLVRSLGGKVLVRHVKSADEEPWWPSRVFGGSRDDLSKRIIDNAHAEGLRVIGYYWHMSDKTAASAHPEWVCRDVQGKTATDVRGDYLDITSPYREVVLARLRELAERGVDGIYFDHSHVPREGCVSPAFKASYRAKTGRNVPTRVDENDADFASFLEYQAEQIAETFAYWKREVQKDYPGVVFVVSSSTLPSLINRRMSTRLTAAVDSAKTEFRLATRIAPNLRAFRGRNAPSEPREDLRIAIGWALLRDAANGRPPHVWSIGFDGEQNALGFAGAAIAWGCIANMDMLEQEFFATSAPARAKRDAIAAVMRLASKASILSGAQPVRWLGVHFPEAGRNRLGGNIGEMARSVVWPMTGAFGVAVDRGLPAGVVTDDQLERDQLTDYEALFLPLPGSLTPKQKAAVDRFRAQGKLVIEQDSGWAWHASRAPAIAFGRMLDGHSRQPQVRVRGLEEGVHAVQFRAPSGQIVVAITNKFDWVEERAEASAREPKRPARGGRSEGVVLEYRTAPARVREAVSGATLRATPAGGVHRVSVPAVDHLSLIVSG